MQIILRCAKCRAIAECDVDLVCRKCHRIGWRCLGEPLPPLTQAEFAGMARLMTFGTKEAPQVLARRARERLRYGGPFGPIERAVVWAYHHYWMAEGSTYE